MKMYLTMEESPCQQKAYLLYDEVCAGYMKLACHSFVFDDQAVAQPHRLSKLLHITPVRRAAQLQNRHLKTSAPGKPHLHSPYSYML